MLRVLLLPIFPLSVLATPVTAGSVDVLIAREESAIAVYLRMPFTDVERLFDQQVPGLTKASGEITYDDLSQGTFDGADRLAQGVTFLLDGSRADFTAMSMMIHQSGFDVPFSTPLDAEIAIGVCGVPIPETPPAPEELIWIGGWFAYPVDGMAELALVFPESGREALQVSVRVFDDSRLSKEMAMTLPDGGTLVFDAECGWWRSLFGG